jgi:dolichyl-phosphate beta-glucosyltransferase
MWFYYLFLVIIYYALFRFFRWFFSPLLSTVGISGSSSIFPPADSNSHTHTPTHLTYPFTCRNPRTGHVLDLPKLLTYSYEPASKGRLSLKVSLTPPSVRLSLVIPAYNEKERLPKMLEETMDYLLRRQKTSKSPFTFELLIVDDGSKDATWEQAEHYIKEYGLELIRLIRLPNNQGKGGAVQQGILHSRGEYILMVDADGATNINDLEKLESAIRELEVRHPSGVLSGHGIAVGSRAHIAENAAAQRAWYRNILMYGFNFLVSTLCVQHIADTQCGFKLFTRRSAAALVMNQHLKRWSFDVELLYIAQTLKIPIKEIAVNWQEIPGSKLAIIESSFLMARDLIIIRGAYLTRLWRILDATKALFQPSKS